MLKYSATAIATVILSTGLLHTEQGLTSKATMIDFESDCSVKAEGAEFQQLVCSGFANFQVMYIYGDLRESIGFYSELSEPSFEFVQTFYGANYVSEEVEWLSSGDLIFATLQTRYVGRVHDTEVAEGIDGEYG